MASFKASISDETEVNRLRQAKYYLTFALHYGVDILSPTVTDSALYQQYLANSLSSPATRRNYTSGARIWIQARGGDASQLSSVESQAVSKGAAKLRPHKPTPAPALTPRDLVLVCQYLDHAYQALPVKAALTVGYFSFLRASNLLSPTTSLWSGPHTLCRRDVTSSPTGLVVVIHTSKTISQADKPAILSLPRIPNSPACPATAWDNYVAQVPASPYSPAFLLFDGTPLNPTQMCVVVREALSAVGCTYAMKFSGHSLRRGGSQAAIKSGSDKNDVATHGTWSSTTGMRPYLPSKSSQRVASNLGTLFAS